MWNEILIYGICNFFIVSFSCCRYVLARLSASQAYFRPPLVLVGPIFSWLLFPPLRITKKGYLSVTFFYYWSGQWDSDPRHQPWQPKKINSKVAVMGILSRYFYGYWYVFAHRRHYQLWYRFQYILDFCTLYIWQLDPVLLCFFTDRKGISHIKHFYAGFYLVMSETFL